MISLYAVQSVRHPACIMHDGKPAYDVVTAVNAVRCVLDQSGSGEVRQRAEQYLEGMVDAPETWRVWDAMLDGQHSQAVQETAAVMLRRKCVKTARALDSRAVGELTSVFMARFRTTQSEGVRRQLGSGVAILLGAQAGQSASHADLPDVIPYVIQAVGASQHHLAQLLTLLPAEVGDVDHALLERLKAAHQGTHRDPCAPPPTADASVDTPLLTSMVRHARQVLSLFATAVTAGSITLAAGLEGFTAWLPFFPDGDVLAETPFLTESLARLHSEDVPLDLRTACHDTVRGVCAVIERVGASAPPASDLITSILRSILKPYRAPTAFPPAGSPAHDAFMFSAVADEAAVQTLAAVACAAVDGFVDGVIPLVVDGSDGALLLSALLFFGEHGEDDAADAAWGFWHAARLSLKRPVGNRAPRQQLVAQLEPCLARLVAIVQRRDILDAAARAAWGDVDSHREKVATPLLRDIASIITPKKYLATAVGELLGSRWSPQAWPEVEVRLYAVACLELLPGPEAWESVSPQLMKFAGALTPEYPHRVYAAFARILPRLTGYFNENHTALSDALQLCHYVLADGGAAAFLRLCSACRDTLVERRAETLNSLMVVFKAAEGLPLDAQGAVSEGLGSVVWTYPAGEIPAVVVQIANPIIERCQAAYGQQQGDALLRSLALLASLLRPAHEWCATTAIETGSPDIPDAVAAAWEGVWAPLWSVLSMCANQAVTGEPIAVQACECIAQLVRVVRCKLRAENLAALLDCILQAHRQRPHTCYLGVFAALAESLAHASEPVPMLVRALSGAADAVDSGKFHDPELLLALFNMLASAMKRGIMRGGRRRQSALAPAVVEAFGGTCLAAATSALESDVVVDARVLCSALGMIDTLLAVPGAPGKAVVTAAGPALVRGLMLCTACKASECTTLLAKIFGTLRKAHGEAFAAWVQQAAAAAHVLSEAERTVFATDITSDGPPTAAAKVAVNKLHRTAHSRAAQL